MKTLKKLNDFKSNELSNVEMSLFKGSMDICTGGGFENVWMSDGNGGVCLSHTYTWTSDAHTQVGPNTWTTVYHGEQVHTGGCW